MAIYGFVEVNRPETQKLADLTGAASDMAATEEICSQFLKEVVGPAANSPGIENRLIRESLCAAALIRYARAFGTSVRKWDHKSTIAGLPDDFIDAHNYFIDLRDKWIAHSVNAFEENTVQVGLVPTEVGPKAIMNVSVTENRVVYLSPLEITNLKSLAERVRTAIQGTIELEKAAVMSFLNTLPIDSLYALEKVPRKVQTKLDHKKRRPRW